MSHIRDLLKAAQTFSRLFTDAANSDSTDLSGWSLQGRDPRVIEQLMPGWSYFYHQYFRVVSEGWEHLTDETAMFVGSHNGGLAAPDMFMLMYDWFCRFGIERPVYGLMHPKVWQVYPGLGQLATQGGAIRAHPKMAIAALRHPASVLVFPGGAQDVFRPYWMRHKIVLHNRKGFIRIALREQVPIVPIVSWGAHDTLIVLGDLYPQLKQLNQWGFPWPLGFDPEVWPIYLGLPWGLTIGPLLNIPFPRQIRLRICPPIRFERYGMTASQDSDYVNHCFGQVQAQMQSALNDLAQSTTPTKDFHEFRG